MALNAETPAKRWYLYALTGFLFLLDFPNGRRAMIYGIILMVIAARLGRFRLRISFFTKITLTVLLGGFLYISTLGFYYFRVAGYSEINPTLSQRVTGVVALIKDKKGAEVTKQFSSNVQKRTFILSFVGELVGYSDAYPTGHGADLVSQFEQAIPSVLFAGKNVYFTEEGLANILFGSYYSDEPNSVFSAGLIDFGVLGLLVYPLFFIFLLRYFIEFASEFIPPFAACFVVLLMLATVLEPEQDVAAYFLVVREGLLTGGAVWILMTMPSIQMTGKRI